jgi:hypothetical protein
MAKGGDSVQKSEVTQSNLPEYARPYFENLMQRSQSLLSQGYTPYGQERIQGFTPEQTQLQQDILGQQTPGEFGTASGLASIAGQRSLDAANYTPGQFRADTVRSGPLNYFQMQGPDSFTQSGMAQQYMSPFVQAALDPQRREALRAAQQGQLTQNLGAARQGAYGGSRQLLATMERERNLGQNLADIQARGMQSAYEQAQGQFNAEQQARQRTGETNLQAALGVQQLGAQQGLQASLANQQQRLEAQRMREQSRQFGAQQGLAGLAQAGQMGQTLSNIGSARSQADLARFGLQTSTAAQKQALQQQYLDTAYQDFLRQRDYPMEMLQQYSSLLRGVPVTPESTKTTYAPSPGIGQQLLGGGLQAASIYKAFSGG